MWAFRSWAGARSRSTYPFARGALWQTQDKPLSSLRHWAAMRRAGGKGSLPPEPPPHAYPLCLNVFLRSLNRFQIILGGPWCVISSAVVIVWSRGAWQGN